MRLLMNGITSQCDGKGQFSSAKQRTLAEIALLSHTGLVRDRNEDNCCFSGWCLPEVHGPTTGAITVQVQYGDSILAGVFDGLGGEWFGEAASYAAAKAFAEATITNDGELVKLFHYANDVVCHEKAVRKAATMGTTATVFYLTEEEVLFGNVGDSLGFIYRNHQLTEVTKRDTNKDLLDKMGLHDAKPSITQYLGIDEHSHGLTPHVFSGKPRLGDVLLAASDGLTDEVGITRIAEILGSNNSVGAMASKLCEAALASGGNDNVTLAICRIAGTA